VLQKRKKDLQGRFLTMDMRMQVEVKGVVHTLSEGSSSCSKPTSSSTNESSCSHIHFRTSLAASSPPCTSIPRDIIRTNTRYML